MKKTRATTLAALAAAILALGVLSAYAGSLTPPGAPAPTMKTLDQVEARTLIKQSDLPLTISQPGSYYFAENLTFSTLNANAITITTDCVSIDLNGFTLTGPGKSAGTLGSGIAYTGLQAQFEVGNGVIRGFRVYGVLLGTQSIVREIRATDNGVGGIRVDDYGQVTNNVCANNGGNGTAYGIYVAAGCVVSKNNCANNGGGASAGTGYGIYSAQGSVISDNACAYTKAGTAGGAAYGIYATNTCTITGNTCRYATSYADGTTAYGIYGSGDCIIRGNTCKYTDGGSGSTNGLGFGIYASTDCLVADNLCVSNTGGGTGTAAGIRASNNSRVEGNHCNTQSGTASRNYGILLDGSECVAISNTAGNNATADIVFDTGTTAGYAGGNLTDIAIVDNGTNNETGSVPSANGTF